MFLPLLFWLQLFFKWRLSYLPCFKCIQFLILTWWVIFSNVNMMLHFLSLFHGWQNRLFLFLTWWLIFYAWHDGLVFMFYIMGYLCNLFVKLDITGYFLIFDMKAYFLCLTRWVCFYVLAFRCSILL